MGMGWDLGETGPETGLVEKMKFGCLGPEALEEDTLALALPSGLAMISG